MVTKDYTNNSIAVRRTVRKLLSSQVSRRDNLKQKCTLREICYIDESETPLWSLTFIPLQDFSLNSSIAYSFKVYY